MLKFILKRLLRFIPILFCISLLGFTLTLYMPGDPVNKILIAQHGANYKSSILNSSELKKELYSEMGLDLPVFYFSLNAYNYCDTLNRIVDKKQRTAAERMTHQYGCWPEIQSYYQEIKSAIANKDPAEHALRALLTAYDTVKLNSLIEQIRSTSPNTGKLIETKMTEIQENTSSLGNYIPTINYNGVKNQYHIWLFGNGVNREGIFRGDFGLSFKTGQPIRDFIWKKLGFSMELILFAMVLAFATAVPTGLRLSRVKSKKKKNLLSLPIYVLYSIPGYLCATLLIFFFANAQTLHWFPESGLYPIGYHPNDHSYIENLLTGLPYMVLPICTYGFSAFAYITKLTTNISTEELNFDYARTALGKGLSIKKVVQKHIFRNTLIPLITIFTQILPAAVGGTLIVELIFQYPGLGKTTYDAAINSNYPVIIAVFTITGLFTLVAYLIADVLYAIADPKLRPKL